MPFKMNYGAEGTPSFLKPYRAIGWENKVWPIEDSRGKFTFSPEDQLKLAWAYLERNCCVSKECNAYFAKLPGKRTLGSIMKDTTFVIHRLVPKLETRRGPVVVPEWDMPTAATAGPDIAINFYTFLLKVKETDDEFILASPPTTVPTPVLAATLLHEIAHSNGASIDKAGPLALQAENSLHACGLGRYFNKAYTG